MGDRRMAEIQMEKGSLFVYTHWDGSRLPEMAEEAVKVAAPRLGDEAYWVRIVVDQITKDGRDKETGFGLMLGPDCEDSYNKNKPSVIIDAATGQVEVKGQRGEPAS